MSIHKLLDSTYLKEDKELAVKTIEDSIQYDFKLVMIKPDIVSTAREMIDSAESSVLVGTVIDFPNGTGGLQAKISEAQQAIMDGADELDYVSNYIGFQNGELSEFSEEILKCTQVGLNQGKVVKWIIETGALSKDEIAEITTTIRDVVTMSFPGRESEVFVKTSTGFYKGTGATVEDVMIMKRNSGKLPVKASGGVSSADDVMKMVRVGATRIGTSQAVNIVTGQEASGY